MTCKSKNFHAFASKKTFWRFEPLKPLSSFSLHTIHVQTDKVFGLLPKYIPRRSVYNGFKLPQLVLHLKFYDPCSVSSQRKFDLMELYHCVLEYVVGNYIRMLAQVSRLRSKDFLINL